MTTPARNQALGTLNNYFRQHKNQIAAALPAHLTPDRMARLALTEFSRNDELAKCTPESIFASVIVSSQMGLEIGISGHGYLVPYKGVCTFIPGWQGLVDLVSRSGRANVHGGAVFEGDYFEYELGSSPFVKHRPSGESDPNKLTHVYGVGQINNTPMPVIEVWPIEKVWKHRDANNKVGKSHYSYKHPEMYARKIPILQVIKYLPKSPELQTALKADLHATNGETGRVINGEFTVDDFMPQSTQQREQQPRREESPALQELKKRLSIAELPEHAASLLETQLVDKCTPDERKYFAQLVGQHIEQLQASA